ncbi:MAG: nucleotidyltransferase family protein [Microthrixaceae bacterium]|nr:nucleotidyltransferase family protein [Microthrixaceae bacterium]
MTWTQADTAESLRAIAIWGLPTETPARPEIRIPTDPAEFDGFASVLQQTRLLGPLLAAESLGDVEIPELLRTDLVTRQQAALLWCIELESRLLQVREWFDDAGGIDHLVIKGSAIAHLDALEPSLRTFADVDLLIAAHDIDRAVEILTRHGAKRPWAQRRPGFDRRFAKSVTMTFGDGMEFDLHRALADGVHGHRIPLDRLFDRTDHYELGGVRFAALNPTDRLLHSAYHLLLGSREPALMNLRDLAGYLAGETASGDLSNSELSIDTVVARVREWRGEEVLATAIDLVEDHLGVVPQHWDDWRRSYTLDQTEAQLIARHRAEGSSLGRAKLDIVRELPWLRTKAAYLTSLAWPTREHLESRGLRRRDALPSSLPLVSRLKRR